MLKENSYPSYLDANDERLFDEFQYMSFKIQNHPYLILTHTNNKLCFIVAIFNILLIEEKISKKDIISAKRQDGYKYIIQAIGKYFYKIHGQVANFAKGNKIKLYDFTRALFLTCMNEIGVNCSFKGSNFVDRCMVKILLDCLNIKLFHTWIPESCNILLELKNSDNLFKLIHSNNLNKIGNYADQLYIRDFVSKDTIFGLTKSGLKSLTSCFTDINTALYYYFQSFYIIFRHNGQILAIELNRNLCINENVLFRSISIKNEETYYNSKFEVVSKEGKVEPLITFTHALPIFPNCILFSSTYFYFNFKDKEEEVNIEQASYFQGQVIFLQYFKEGLVQELLEKHHKKASTQGASQIKPQSKSPGVRNFLPFLTMPIISEAQQPYYNFSSQIPEKKEDQNKPETEFPVNQSADYQPHLTYFPEQPYMVLCYSWPPFFLIFLLIYRYYWYLQSGNPNPYYVHNVYIQNPYYRMLEKTVQSQQPRSQIAQECQDSESVKKSLK
ncbi:hypothetical protein HZS_806 [Henneguya salminicola]|nr:hypothetical protein HZS_806 [Henneguya salminicola]